MPLCLAVFRVERRLKHLPGNGLTYRPSAQRNDVDVIVLDALARRESIGDERCADSGDFVSADARPNTAAAQCDTALDHTFGNGFGKRDDELRIVVPRFLEERAEIEDLMTCRAQACGKVLFQLEASVVSSDSNTHVIYSDLAARR